MAPSGRRSGPLRGGKKGDVYRIGGIDVPWDPQLDLDAPRPTPLQPESNTSPPKPLSTSEKSEVKHFLAIRDKMRKGPLHAVLGDQARVSKERGVGATVTAATFDAFRGMGGYSARYAPERNVLPRLQGSIFVKEFFPRELWATIDPQGHRSDGTQKGTGKGKGTQKSSNSRKVEELNLLENERDEERDGDERDKVSDEENVEEDVDEDFDEEDDEGGDYNAEQYFDDGGDDAGDDGDAADDGGVDYI